MNLGPFGVVTPDAARSWALQALASVEAGDDPLERKLEKYRAITVIHRKSNTRQARACG
jgi:hypothetical protein